MGVERIPDLQQAMPPKRMKPSRTTRILKPSIVLISVVVLVATSTTGIYIAASTFSSSPHGMTVMVAQGMILGAAILSMSYVVFHIFAMMDNDPVGIVRPPVLRLHAACFIVARLALVMWIIAMIASIVEVSRQNICMSGGRDCKVAVVNVTISNLACFATGTVLTALEACKYPFQAPKMLHIAQKLTRRVSPSGEDLLDRSVSCASSFERDSPSEGENRRGVEPRKSKQKPLPNLPPLPVDEHPERQFAPVMPTTQRIKSRGWGDDRRHPGARPERKRMTKSDSAVSGFSRSSSGYISSDHSSDTSLSRRQKRPRIITPSSSISNLTKRSPLSTMRSAEFPDIMVRPQLRYCPPTILAPHEWNLPRPGSMTNIILMGDGRYSQRRSSVSMPPQYVLRRPSMTLPPLGHQGGRVPPIVRRRTADVKRSRSNAYRPSFDYEKSLEEHAKMIEAVSIVRSVSGSSDHIPRPPPKDPVKRIAKLQAPQRIDSRARYREQRPIIRSQTTVGPREVISRLHMSRPYTAKPETEATSNVMPLRRLSLGDISSGLGELFDV
ncbi:uncharacterized protein BP5553_00927 [Venustampulla echinocandica]|uniref:Uncharacterized protein n=1 Tax=Venustampulla echinocandica TaxID=2656787 RepID=A0A370TZN2_9HELO|nr:uncharacterized protein BP5553_00927 [Venustampulla echinocandica]RDL40948.1 hypothetical protein BP5553_00927 [Venustampulla echinocandica]